MPETAPLPQAVGPYLIRAKLGAGSMAAVYRAYDTRIQREVALKVLQLYLVGNESASKRFEREAQTLINFHHPHILPVFDYGWDGDTPYYAMPLMSGRSLADLLKSAPLPLPQVGEITRQIASALDYAHRHHIIHRDIKPKNILLDDHDTPFLADFGVALATKSPRLTSQGNFIGTVAYASPEQCRGDTVNSPADIYGLAVIVFQMVTGHPLFEAPSPLAMMMKHMNEAPPNPLAYNSRLPVGLYAVLAKALAKLPENRYETAKKFSEALDEVLGLFTPPPQADDDAWLGAAPPAAPPPPPNPCTCQRRLNLPTTFLPPSPSTLTILPCRPPSNPPLNFPTTIRLSHPRRRLSHRSPRSSSPYPRAVPGLSPGWPGASTPPSRFRLSRCSPQ
ncbi:MAG TPA: serine/threonine-protein kinase [Aggregatilineaceae bacterium]|nr:serine/threonine-protein kinase [Aggregatilineaceae bacterium]